MKKFFKVLIPILLVLAILACLVWYLFVYDRAFTRDILLYSARLCDSNNRPGIAAWFYDLAYDQAVDSDEVAIELAQQHKNDSNYTQAEVILSNALMDHSSTSLYIALSKTYVEQDKLLDAVKLLNGITNPEILKDMETLRPAAPTASPEPGFYNQYIPVSITGTGGTLYAASNNEYPSIHSEPYNDSIVLQDGENTIYAVVVADNGLVSPLSIFGYTVGGIIEEVVFADPAVESYVRQLLAVDESTVLMSNQLWSITSFIMPAGATSYDDLKYMPYLKSLDIRDGLANQLSALSSLSELESLSIYNTPITTEELEIIGSFTKLQSLTLSGCGLSTIAPLDALTGITYLDLSGNALRNIEPVRSMSGLTELYLQNNALTELSSLSSCGALTKLNVSYNSLTTLASLYNLKNLTWLDANHNALSDLMNIGNLANLTYLDVSFNSIKEMAPLRNCTALVELNISNNYISDISGVEGMMDLVVLNFSHNQVTALPGFSLDCALVTIDGSYNQLKSIDALSGLLSLNSVFMDYNENLSSIKSLANCPKLIVVNVYGTKVTKVEDLTDLNIIVNYDPTLVKP